MKHLETIRLEMWKQKYSITKMAKIVGIGRPTLSNIMNLKQDPHHSTVEKMADELGLELKNIGIK